MRALGPGTGRAGVGLVGALLLVMAGCGGEAPADAGNEGTVGEAEAPAVGPATGSDGGAAQDDMAPDPDVVGTLQTVFDALETGDGALLRSVVAPEVVMHFAETRDGETTYGSATLDGLVERIESSPEPLIERMWDPEVRVDGALATIWAPYDFYAGSELSHCGTDAATMLRQADGSWQIVALSWTRAQPPACALHPEGPPG